MFSGGIEKQHRAVIGCLSFFGFLRPDLSPWGLAFSVWIVFSGVFFCRSWPSSLWTVSDAVSSKVGKVLSIEPSANSFVYKEINALYKNWMIYFGGTDRPGELCCNVSFFNDFSQIRNFSTQFPDLDSESLALLNLWPCLNPSIYTAVAFPLSWNPDRFFSVSIVFPSNSKWGCSFS